MRRTLYSPALLQALHENLKNIYEVKTTTPNDQKLKDARTPGVEQIADTQTQTPIARAGESFNPERNIM